MNKDSETSETTSVPSEMDLLLAEAECLTAQADVAQGLANTLRKMAEFKVQIAKSLLPLPLFPDEQRH